MRQDARRYSAEEIESLRDRVEILSALHAALRRWPEVAALAFESDSAESLLADVGALLSVSPEAAQAVLDMQVRRISCEERERIEADLEHWELGLRTALGQSTD